MIPTGILLETHFESPPQVVLADRSEIQQLAFNLILNARDAIAKTGVIRVETRKRDDERAELIVSDNGSGMSEEVQKHIFDPFFTTKPIGMGTGLGMSNIRRIVEEMSATIELTSAIDGGTTFTITFDPSDRSPLSAEDPTSFDGNGERLLVVEDDISVRAVLVQALRKSGYDVSEARGLVDALAVARKCEPALVVTDVMMPGGSGLELVNELRRTAPHLPILLYSGYGVPEQVTAILKQPLVEYLSKPTPEKLLRATVARLLGGAQQARLAGAKTALQ
jgi:CheY-like chemotaxis protein